MRQQFLEIIDRLDADAIRALLQAAEALQQSAEDRAACPPAAHQK